MGGCVLGKERLQRLGGAIESGIGHVCGEGEWRVDEAQSLKAASGSKEKAEEGQEKEKEARGSKEKGEEGQEKEEEEEEEEEEDEEQEQGEVPQAHQGCR